MSLCGWGQGFCATSLRSGLDELACVGDFDEVAHLLFLIACQHVPLTQILSLRKKSSDACGFDCWRMMMLYQVVGYKAFDLKKGKMLKIISALLLSCLAYLGNLRLSNIGACTFWNSQLPHLWFTCQPFLVL